MHISRRFDIASVADPAAFSIKEKDRKSGVVGFDGSIGKFIGFVLSLIGKTVYDKENDRYLNCKSLKNWLIRVKPDMKTNPELKEGVHDFNWVKTCVFDVKKLVEEKSLASIQDTESLNDWIQEGPLDEQANRRKAALEIIACKNEKSMRLILSGLNLTSLPTIIFNCQHIQKLFILGNCLTELPSEIGKLCNLGHLDVSNNQLTSFPKELFSITQISVIKAQQNNFSPEYIESCQPYRKQIMFTW